MPMAKNTSGAPHHLLRFTVVAAVVAAAVSSSCTVVAPFDPYDYPACENGDPGAVRDFVLILDGMEVHRGDLMEFQVVSENNFVQALAVLDPLPADTFTLRMPNAMQEGLHAIVFWADLSGNRLYEPPPTDHAWRLEPCNSGVHRFRHTSNFLDISTGAASPIGGDFVMALEGMDPHVGQLMEFFVIEENTRRMVGYYRLADPATTAYTITLPGIIEQNAHYVVAFYADKNQNLAYDLPDEDHAWRITADGDATGLFIQFSHHTDFDDIGPDIDR